MQLLSYWIDVRLAGFSPQFAYAHQVCSFLLTLLILYLVLLPTLRNDGIAALALCVIWLLLPATAVVLQLLATRHYMEGLLFSLLVVYLLQRLPGDEGGRRWIAHLAVVLCTSAALLFKEIFVPVVPAVVLLLAWRSRQRGLALSTIAAVGGYTIYRFWMIGAAFDYGVPWMNARQYLSFLLKLPYTLSSNYGGYLVSAIIAVLCFYFVRRNSENRRAIVYFLAAIALSLAAVLPVSYPLFGSIRTPGTWYRIVFLVHTVVIGFGGYLAVRCASRRTQLALALAAMAILIPGVEKTRRLWTEMTASAEREGKFYLANPDKVLLSEQAAWWFIPGVHDMYGVAAPHYVLLKDLKDGRANPGQPVWRFRDGRFVPDDHPLMRGGEGAP